MTNCALLAVENTVAKFGHVAQARIFTTTATAYLDHGYCPRSLDHGTTHKLAGSLDAMFQYRLPSCTDTAWGKPLSDAITYAFCLIILFEIPQQPQVLAAIPARWYSDPFYGHENTARLCARFIEHLFCDGQLSTSSDSNSTFTYFIAHALYRTNFHSSVAFGALVLLQRLKARFPTVFGSSGQRLFITAFMIASKVISDDKYSNKTWSVVGQSMFQLWDINQMELEMCQYLDWELNFEPVSFKEFEDMVRKDFAGPGPYPTYALPTIFKSASSTANSLPIVALNHFTSPISSFGPGHTSPPKPTPSPPQIHSPNLQPAYISPSFKPDTPSLCRSDSTSPVSSASPPTPTGIVDDLVAITEPNNSPRLLIRQSQESHIDAAILKQKTFAFAAPSIW